MNFWTGFLVGIASLIPGISGGTILMVTKRYEMISMAISNFSKKENKVILLWLVIGIISGAIVFARIMEMLFYFVPEMTMTFVSGLVLFSIPNFINEEKIKPKMLWFSLGFMVIYGLAMISHNSQLVIKEMPKITVLFLIWFSFCGMIDGFLTILPGISGSMVMMILGPYFLYKSFLANLNLEHLIFVIPLLCYFIGDILGFYLGSKVSIYFLNKKRLNFLSFILGMVIMSVIVILPPLKLELNYLILYLLTLFFSYVVSKLFTV